MRRGRSRMGCRVMGITEKSRVGLSRTEGRVNEKRL